jgi:phosphoglycolate phosphatase
MKNQFDLLIFDWDGTLIDTIGWITHCLQTAAELAGCPKPTAEAAKGVIGLSIHRATETLHPHADDALHHQLVKHYSQLYASKQLSRDDLFAGVYDMLVSLKQRGYLLAVATGKTRAGLQDALHATQTLDLFTATRCADETASKPDPKMLAEIMQVTGVAKERTLMIGDSVHDLQMASNAPISCVAVTCGANTADALQHYQPLLCLQQPSQLLAHL